MSPPSREQNASAPRSGETATPHRRTLPGRSIREPLLTLVRRVSFWAAVSIPFLYVPLLLTGIETTAETVAFLALLVLHVVTLVAGHSHNR